MRPKPECLLNYQYSNAMEVEFSEDLIPTIGKEGSNLQVQAKFVQESAIEDGYLKRGYGNAYDFDQKDSLEGFF